MKLSKSLLTFKDIYQARKECNSPAKSENSLKSRRSSVKSQVHRNYNNLTVTPCKMVVAVSESSPGPAAYNSSRSVFDKPKKSFGTISQAKRIEDIRYSPGPGAYLKSATTLTKGVPIPSTPRKTIFEEMQ